MFLNASFTCVAKSEKPSNNGKVYYDVSVRDWADNIVKVNCSNAVFKEVQRDFEYDGVFDFIAGGKWEPRLILASVCVKKDNLVLEKK